MKNPNSEQQGNTLEKRLTYAIAQYAVARLEIEKWNWEINILWRARQTGDNPVGFAEV